MTTNVKAPEMFAPFMTQQFQPNAFACFTCFGQWFECGMGWESPANENVNVEFMRNWSQSKAGMPGFAAMVAVFSETANNAARFNMMMNNR